MQTISERNTRNRAQQKWRHRMGPKNFAIIRERLVISSANDIQSYGLVC